MSKLQSSQVRVLALQSLGYSWIIKYWVIFSYMHHWRWKFPLLRYRWNYGGATANWICRRGTQLLWRWSPHMLGWWLPQHVRQPPTHWCKYGPLIALSYYLKIIWWQRSAIQTYWPGHYWRVLVTDARRVPKNQKILGTQSHHGLWLRPMWDQVQRVGAWEPRIHRFQILKE